MQDAQVCASVCCALMATSPDRGPARKTTAKATADTMQTVKVLLHDITLASSGLPERTVQAHAVLAGCAFWSMQLLILKLPT